MTTTQSRPGLLSTAGLVVVTLLTLLAVWTASAGGRWSAEFGPIENADLEPPPLPETPPPPPPTGDVGFDARLLVLATLGAIMLVVIAAGLGIALKAVRVPWQSREVPIDDDGGPGDASSPLTADVVPDIIELREGIAQAWARLAEHREPSDAIQAAWVAVEEGASRSGVPREASATPTEFTVAVLGRTAADPAATRTLLGLYHRARFSTHPATDDDVRLAGQCLETLAEGLEDGPAARSGSTA